MNSRLNFRITKTAQSLFKQNKYQIRIDGNSMGEIGAENPNFSENLVSGKYSIEVGEKDQFIKKDIILGVGQMQTITINPSLTYPLIKSLLIVIVAASIIVQIFLLPKINPLLVIPLLSLLFLTKKNNGERFTLSISKT